MKKDHREKTVRGMVVLNGGLGKMKFFEDDVDVRMTADETGKSLSLQVQGVMIEISLDDVKEIITLTERSGK